MSIVHLLRSATTTFLTTVSFGLVMIAMAHAQEPEASSNKEDVVRISTNLIQLDVSVVDGNNRPVIDLMRNDFEIFENGKPRAIKNFTFVSNASSRGRSVEPGGQALRQTSKPLTAQSTRRIFALVVDDLSLSFESTKLVRSSLSKFISEEVHDGDLIAVIKTGANTGILQQFTSNKEILRAAVEQVRWKGGRTPAASLAGNNPNSEVDLRDELATASLSALNHIIKGLDALPGRKSVVFFSDGFPLVVKNESGFPDTARVVESIRKITDSSQRSGAVVHTVDARGLDPAGTNAGDPMKGFRHTNAILAGRRQQLAENQDGLKVLAKETGGFSIVNTNDLVEGLAKIIENPGYYEIGYEPQEETFDPVTNRYNKIEIKIKRDGLTPRYRSGFFSQPDELPSRRAAVGTDPIAAALASPFAENAVTLSLHTMYARDDQNKPFVKSLLHIDGGNLTFTEKPETKTFVLDFEVLAISFADNGTERDRLGKTYTIEMPASGKEKLIREGIVYYFAFPVSAPGPYQYRVAVRDKATGKIGTASQFVNVADEKNKGFVLSGIGLESITKAEWSRNSGKTGVDGESTALRDTSLRQFKTGTVLTYALEIYNQTFGPNPSAKVMSQPRLFKDGKVVFTGTTTPTSPGATRRTASGALSLDLEPGEYLLQIEVTDPDRKLPTAIQSVSLEIVR